MDQQDPNVYTTPIEDAPATLVGSTRRRWWWTRRLAIVIAIVPFTFQFTVGLYQGLTQPPPPPGLANAGFAIMLGAFATGVFFAIVGAAIGFVVDVVMFHVRVEPQPSFPPDE